MIRRKAAIIATVSASDEKFNIFSVDFTKV
jgi:hypothetical protein